MCAWAGPWVVAVMTKTRACPVHWMSLDEGDLTSTSTALIVLGIPRYLYVEPLGISQVLAALTSKSLLQVSTQVCH